MIYYDYYDFVFYEYSHNALKIKKTPSLRACPLTVRHCGLDPQSPFCWDCFFGGIAGVIPCRGTERNDGAIRMLFVYFYFFIKSLIIRE
jgi:hypothetical protein